MDVMSCFPGACMPLTAWDFVKTNEDSFMEIYCVSAKTSVDGKKDSDRPTSRFMLHEVTSCPFGWEQMIPHPLHGSDKSFAHLVLKRRYVIHTYVGVRYVASAFCVKLATERKRPSPKCLRRCKWNDIHPKRKTYAYSVFLPLKKLRKITLIMAANCATISLKLHKLWFLGQNWIFVEKVQFVCTFM